MLELLLNLSCLEIGLITLLIYNCDMILDNVLLIEC